MEYVQFGSTEFKVSRLALGCMSMSGAYGPADDNESIATLHKAFDLGINFLDTSASYGSGHNHELINKALKGRRERIVIHSKSGSPRAPDTSGMRSGSTPEYLTQNCEQSVKRLGVDALDIFCMSRVDPDIPIEESVGAMAKLVERGLTRYIGLSEASANSIRRARATGLGVNHDALAPAFERSVDQLVIVPLSIARRGVEKVDAEIERPVQGGDRLVVIRRPVGAGHAHATQRQVRHFEFRRTELNVFHRILRTAPRVSASGSKKSNLQNR